MNGHGGARPAYTLYATRTQPREYRLVTSVSGHVWRVLWRLETEYSVFVTPEAGLTGMLFFWDEVVKVEVLPG